MKDEDREPDLGPFGYYLDAFRELSSCRVSGMAIGPIPFTAIVEYSRIYVTDSFEDFHYIIRLMDDAFLSLEAKEKAKQKETKPNVPSNSGKTN